MVIGRPALLPDLPESTEGLESFLQLTTVARLLDAGMSTLRNWIDKGLINTVRIPGIKGERIAKSEYIRFIDTRFGGTPIQ